MTMKRKTAAFVIVVAVVAAVAVAVLPVVLHGQSANVKSANYSYRADYDSTTLTYCKMVGLGDNPYGGPISGKGTIKTTGSAVAVTENVAGTNPFVGMGVDDVVVVFNPVTRVWERRTISIWTDAANIEVDTAVNWQNGTAGVIWAWLDSQCGTTDAFGWVDASGLAAKSVCFQLEQISGVTGGIDVRIEHKSQAMGSLPNPLHPGSDAAAKCNPGTTAGGFCNFTTAGITTGRFCVGVPRDIVTGQLRIGIKIGTSETAESVEGDRERITSWIEYESER